ncbi:MAG: abortive infection system antitoxin AbiGi family protein [Fulvivirga sp.]
MNISANTLFHFTSSLINIESILDNKFQISYCRETFNLDGMESGDFFFPMICFCDIPLASAKDHIDKYGNYGIGMTKEWGIKNRLNPVLYVEKQSNVSKIIKKQVFDSDKILHLIEKVAEVNSELAKPFIEPFKGSINNNTDLLRYIKNYQGDLIRAENTYSDYRFYDEREWRFVPDFSRTKPKWNLTKEEYNAYRGTGTSKPLIDDPKLSFNSEDIRHLIVKQDSDIPKLIRKN